MNIQEIDVLKIHKHKPEKKIEFKGKGVAEILFHNALYDVEKNYCMETKYGKVYAAGGYGKAWEGIAFNRDTSISGLFALNALYPKEMLDTFKIIRKCRYDMGYACYPDFVLEGIEGVKVYDMDLEAFRKKFHMSSSINSSDDVIWIWGAYDLIKKHGFDEWQWLYDNGKKSFDELYEPFFDEKDNLYFGQPLFVDVGETGYPEEFGMKTQSARNSGVWVKAASTNAVYYKALKIMAEAAEITGNNASEWEQKAERLKYAIKEKLRLKDKSFTYFMHRDGHLEERREVLGAALVVLCGVVDGKDAVKAVENYPVTPYGAPLIYPFYENDMYYHNNSSWPFADTFLILAYEKAIGENLDDLNMQIMINSAREGHLYEVRNLIINQIRGTKAQLWTSAGYLNLCIRMGLTELPKEYAKIN